MIDIPGLNYRANRYQEAYDNFRKILFWVVKLRPPSAHAVSTSFP